MARSLAVVGDIFLDVRATVGALSSAGEKHGDVYLCPGGTATNVAGAAAAVALGINVTLWGRVGADTVGQHLSSQLSAQGISVNSQKMGRTGRILCLESNQGVYFVVDVPDARDRRSELKQLRISSFNALHISGNWLLDCVIASERVGNWWRDLSEKCRQAEVTLTVDLPTGDRLTNSHGAALYSALADLAPTVVFASSSELRDYDLLRSRLPRSSLIVTDGADPVKIINSVTHILPVDPVIRHHHRTGAGDYLAGAALAALVSGQSLASSIEFGIRAARKFILSPEHERF